MPQTTRTYENNERVARMQRCGEAFQLKEYYQLSEALVKELQGEDLGEVLLSRAQLKLMTTDISLGDDLQRARELLPQGSRFSSFLDTFQPWDPNGFILFRPEENDLNRFVAALPSMTEAMRNLGGIRAAQFCRQIESEIRYFTGNFAEAAALAEPLFRQAVRQDDAVCGIMAAYVLLRCHLAEGHVSDAEEVMMQMIRWAKENTCENVRRMYTTIRSWTNLTTGWQGDTPRYHVTPDGAVFPALEDRMAAVQKGISELGPTEEPFAEYARLSHPAICTMRELFMRIFNAMIHYKYGDKQVSTSMFYSAYVTAKGSGLVMPFVEYGRQILPLLNFALERDHEKYYDREWMEHLADMAEQYEEGLQRYRGE